RTPTQKPAPSRDTTFDGLTPAQISAKLKELREQLARAEEQLPYNEAEVAKARERLATAMLQQAPEAEIESLEAELAEAENRLDQLKTFIRSRKSKIATGIDISFDGLTPTEIRAKLWELRSDLAKTETEIRDLGADLAKALAKLGSLLADPTANARDIEFWQGALN